MTGKAFFERTWQCVSMSSIISTAELCGHIAFEKLHILSENERSYETHYTTENDY
jgi:hypothetical protein